MSPDDSLPDGPDSLPPGLTREELQHYGDVLPDDFSGQETQRLIAVMQQLHVRFGTALQLRGHIIVPGAQDEEALAWELAREHEDLNRAHLFANAIRMAAGGNLVPLYAARDDAKKTGGFLERYSQEKMLQRVRGAAADPPSWILARSFGKIISDGRLEDVRGGIQIEMPTLHAPAIAEDVLPHEGDLMYTEHNVAANLEYIRLHPSSAAVVRDIYSLKPHQELASCARDTAFRSIMQQNALRPADERVRFLLAAIFSIRGLQTGGQSLLLSTMNERPVENVISLRIHANSLKYPSSMGWKLIERNVPVEIDGQSAELITDWHVLVTDLEEVAQRMRIAELTKSDS